MLRHYSYNDFTPEALLALCRRPAVESANVIPTVQAILAEVREKGDQAVLDYTRKFDKVVPESLLYSVRPAAEIPVGQNVRDAFYRAFENLTSFHRAQAPKNLEVQTMPGVVCRREARPIERVGLYIPGGTAPLPSTALMLGVPALIAECPVKVMATPPDEHGKPPAVIELAASLCQIEHIYLAGGAQAVAAMGYGTQLMPKMDKIFGPGNAYVTAAKMLLSNSDALVSMDLPAGPSEVMVVAGPEADPGFVACDLLSQAEHGPDSQVVLVSVGGLDMQAVQRELAREMHTLPRADIAREALKHSFSISVDTDAQALEIINTYAPEHLILLLDNAGALLPGIQHAGSVFVGHWTPESVGDYASGTNHTLPTYGYARMYSGVSVESFLKYITFQELTPRGLTDLAPAVTTMAETEQLEAHRRAVTIRLARLHEAQVSSPPEESGASDHSSPAGKTAPEGPGASDHSSPTGKAAPGSEF